MKTSRVFSAVVGAVLAGAFAASAQSVSDATACHDAPGPGTSLPSFAYDVASIRPHPVNDGSVTLHNPVHEATISVTGVTLRNLIELAYGIDDYQLAGGPQDVLLERFDLRATSDPGSNEALGKLTDCQAMWVKRSMLRGILEERMKLVTHTVPKQTSGYSLVVAKGGQKLHGSAADPGDPPGLRAGSMAMYARKSGFDTTFKKYSTGEFAAWLTSTLGKPTTDETGLAGTYDFTLQYAPEEMLSSGSAAADFFPSLFTAVQEQLGLKLETTKVTVPTVMIDHIESPTAN